MGQKPNNVDRGTLSNSLVQDYLALLENTSDFIYIKDTEHRFTSTSLAFAKLTGHSDWRQLIGKTDFDIFAKDHATRYYQDERQVIEQGTPLIDHEEPYYDEQGNTRWVTSSKHPVRDEQGNVVGLVGISKDITDIKNYQALIKELANYDELTGLANRRLFNEVFSNVLARAQRNHENLALLYVDLDNFKEVNDHNGHATGDLVLKNVASQLTEQARSCDLLARIGGDEFVLVMSSRHRIQEPAVQTAKRIIAAIEAIPRQDCRPAELSCSIGIACYPDDGDSLADLLACADTLMYDAKHEGKHKVKCSTRGSN